MRVNAGKVPAFSFVFYREQFKKRGKEIEKGNNIYLFGGIYIQYYGGGSEDRRKQNKFCSIDFFEIFFGRIDFNSRGNS